MNWLGKIRSRFTKAKDPLKPRQVVTPEFLEKVRTEGAIAKAYAMLPLDLSQLDVLPRKSTWELICEEIVDTEHELAFMMKVAAELKRRGIDSSELERMRMFAWRTAGWLNYEKMLWEWVRLDERHIRKALDLQLAEGEITDQERREALQYLARFENRQDPSREPL